MSLRQAARKLTRPVCAIAALAVAVTAPAAGDPPDSYRISALDIVEVLVTDAPDLSAVRPNALQVGPDGSIALPHIGHIRVHGLTCDEAARAIERRLAPDILIRPEVLVRVVEYRGQRINVIGAVASPGSFLHRPGMTIHDAIAAAGGFATADGRPTSQVEVRVISADGESRTIPLAGAIAAVDGGGTLLEPGDTLLFEREATVAVLGCVRQPGTFTLQADTTLAEVLARAGGPIEDRADLTAVVVNHADGAVDLRDLTDALRGEGSDETPVRAGDLVYVPRSTRQASVLGYVASPGSFDFREGERALDLLARGGGARPGPEAGDLSRVTLSRRDGSARTLDLQAALADSADPEHNPPLLPGDIITVPATANRVVVTGFVPRPGYYEFQPGDTVSAAVAMSGAALDGSASPSGVRLRHRGGEERVVHLDREDPLLQPGDTITVPWVQDRVAVLGHVRTPGLYAHHPGDTVVDMLAAAGGPMPVRSSDNFQTQRGNPRRLLLFREADAGDAAREVDLTDFYRRGDRGANPQVRPGDIIFVPGQRRLDVETIVRDLLILPRALSSLFGD